MHEFGGHLPKIRFTSHIFNQPVRLFFTSEFLYRLSVWCRAVVQFRRIVRGFLSLRHVFTPTAIHMQFVVDKMTLGQASLPVLRFGPASFILPMVHTHWFIY